MKTTDPRDPLDRKIDELLASQPVKASSDFVARTLAAAEEVQTDTPQQKSSGLAPLIRFALPAAAAVALAFILISQFTNTAQQAPSELAQTDPVTTPEDLTTEPAQATEPTLIESTPIEPVQDVALVQVEVPSMIKYVASEEAQPTMAASSILTEDELSDTEIQELLLLQEGLSGFADLDTEDLSNDSLLESLDIIYSI
ncbi:MAG: hypothetical protein AAF065_13810 [Verrucomicrobiota bacterium]